MTKPLSERLEAITKAPGIAMHAAYVEAIREAAALARRVEGAPTTQAIVAGWLAKAGVYDEDGCNESDVAAKQLRWCAAELVSDCGQRVRLVPEVGA